jgi:hypothetical protein
MNNERLNIQMAKLEKWTEIRMYEPTLHTARLMGFHKDVFHLKEIPDYCNDLNAVQRVEQGMTPQQKRRYDQILDFMVFKESKEKDTYYTWGATAEQRARACCISFRL